MRQGAITSIQGGARHRQWMVDQPCRELGQKTGAGGRDDDDVAVACEREVGACRSPAADPTSRSRFSRPVTPRAAACRKRCVLSHRASVRKRLLKKADLGDGYKVEDHAKGYRKKTGARHADDPQPQNGASIPLSKLSTTLRDQPSLQSTSTRIRGARKGKRLPQEERGQRCPRSATNCVRLLRVAVVRQPLRLRNGVALRAR